MGQQGVRSRVQWTQVAPGGRQGRAQPHTLLVAVHKRRAHECQGGQVTLGMRVGRRRFTFVRDLGTNERHARVVVIKR